MTTLERDKKYLIQCYTTDDVVLPAEKACICMRRKGKNIWTFSGQFSACTLGHGNEELIEALKEQMEKLVSVTSCFATEERAALAEK